MSVGVYNPELGKWVEDYSRPFPQITEHPGIPGQEGLREVFEPILEDFIKRYGEEQIPITVSFHGENRAGYGSVINDPKSTRASFGRIYSPQETADPTDDKDEIMKKANYNYVGLYFSPAYHKHAVEPLSFNYSRFDYRTMTHTKEEYSYYFGAYASGLAPIGVENLQNQEEIEEAQQKLRMALGNLTVGQELSEVELTDIQKEHIYWTNVILETYYLYSQKDILGKHPKVGGSYWMNRAPERPFLDQVVKELNPDVPDAKSVELVPFLFRAAKEAVDNSWDEQYRVNDDYTISKTQY